MEGKDNSGIKIRKKKIVNELRLSDYIKESNYDKGYKKIFFIGACRPVYVNKSEEIIIVSFKF